MRDTSPPKRQALPNHSLPSQLLQPQLHSSSLPFPSPASFKLGSTVPDIPSTQLRGFKPPFIATSNESTSVSNLVQQASSRISNLTPRPGIITVRNFALTVNYLQINAKVVVTQVYKSTEDTLSTEADQIKGLTGINCIDESWSEHKDNRISPAWIFLNIGTRKKDDVLLLLHPNHDKTIPKTSSCILL